MNFKGKKSFSIKKMRKGLTLRMTVIICPSHKQMQKTKEASIPKAISMELLKQPYASLTLVLSFKRNQMRS